jgi:hypothetical protein
MATAMKIINKARSYIGYKEEPPGSNKCIFNRDYYGWDAPYYWCCTFVWDIFRMCGASSLFFNGQKTASCTAVLNWGRQYGLIVKNTEGRTGDLILFDWDGSGDADHIGFIEEKNPDGTYTTIEGNTQISGNQSNGDEVMRRTRKDCIRAIIRPKYEEDNMKYRAFCQYYAWRAWSKDGEIAGTVGEGKRMEALQFSKESQVTAQCHCQQYGDMNPVAPGNIIGTVAESLRMEAIKLDAPYKIRYKVHIQGIGWSDWFTNGQWAGTKGQGRRLEAIVVEKA